MKTWFDSDLQLRRQMIANIAQEKNIEAATIEKDWFVYNIRLSFLRKGVICCPL